MELPREEWDKPTTSRFFLVVLLLAAVALGGWVFLTAQDASLIYDDMAETVKNEPVIATTVEIGDDTLTVPSWTVFHPGNLWDIITKASPLDKTFVPSLEPVTVAATSDGDMRLTPAADLAVKHMFDAAAADDIHLMLSSAYRSATDQQTLYTTYEQTKGKAYVTAYVAIPGASEHQSGYAVDIASASTDCQTNSDTCTLSYDAIAWLRTNAATYGFLQRYPSGKQSITGVAGEEWHYRYVGTTLAKLLTTHELTLDEFVQQTAPAYAKI